MRRDKCLLGRFWTFSDFSRFPFVVCRESKQACQHPAAACAEGWVITPRRGSLESKSRHVNSPCAPPVPQASSAAIRPSIRPSAAHTGEELHGISTSSFFRCRDGTGPGCGPGNSTRHDCVCGGFVAASSCPHVSRMAIALGGIRLQRAPGSVEVHSAAVTSASPRLVQVEINRPDKANAMSSTFFEELRECFDRLAVDPACRAIVLCGAGEDMDFVLLIWTPL